MKFTSLVVIAALFATQEAQAIRLTKSCPDTGKDKDIKIIKEAMDKFVAKHEEVAERIKRNK